MTERTNPLPKNQTTRAAASPVPADAGFGAGEGAETMDREAQWAQVRTDLRRTIGARSFDNWLGQVSLQGYCDMDQTVLLGLPSAFVANWVTNNFGEHLTLAWRQVASEVMNVRLVVADGSRAGAFPASGLLRIGDVPPDLPAPDHAATNARGTAPALQIVSQGDSVDAGSRATSGALAAAAPVSGALSVTPSRFDSQFTFDRFVTGDTNRIAVNAAHALAEGGALRFNPLFLHGATGQGKTHLLHAIGHSFTACHPDSRALVLSAERFMVDFVHAVRARDTFAFKARLRSVDLLMIDDFQFIAGKETTQEEFLYTIDALTQGQAKLVIAADRSPHALDGIEARILSRLTQGLVVDIHPADRVLRRAILVAKVAERGMPVPPEVIDLLAERISASVRELEGALNRLVAYAGLAGRPIDRDFAEEVLAEMFRASRRRVSIEDIQKQVATHFQLRLTEMMSARRARAVARPRQIAMYLAKQLTPRSFPEIGRRFGGRDHTTVIHAVRQIEKLRGEDAEVDGHVRALLRTLEG